MQKYIKYLKISYEIEMILGIIFSCFVSFFLGIMSTDSPSSTYLDFILGIVFGFLIIAIPSISIPYLAIKELNDYETKRKLIFNIINIIFIFFFLFMPLALWQFYMLYKIKKM